MTALHRREPVRLVLLGVALGADAEEPAVEQADGAGEHALTHEPAPRRSCDTAPRRAGSTRANRTISSNFSRSRRLRHPGGRGTGAGRPRRCPTAWMWPLGSRADPDVGPRRRDHQAADPLEGGRVDALARLTPSTRSRGPAGAGRGPAPSSPPSAVAARLPPPRSAPGPEPRGSRTPFLRGKRPSGPRR